MSPVTAQTLPVSPIATMESRLVSIDVARAFRVEDPVRATYEIANFLQGIEQIRVTTLRTLIEAQPLATTLAGRAGVSRSLAQALDEVTGRWGVKVTRVEVQRLEPIHQGAHEAQSQHIGKE
jgi:regulator of protease activity HflC (stomatin/prohibitin superfamily)